jgi:Polyketide cyclase / dehydrase and lipid transport
VTTVTTERIVQGPAAEVFRFVATEHFANHPKWDPDVLEMTPTTPGPIGVGSTARVVRRQGRSRVEGTATVTAYDPDRLAAFHVRFGPFELRQRVECIPEHEGRATRLRLTIRTQATGPLRPLVPLMRRRFRRTMQRSLATIATSIANREEAPTHGP